MRSSGPILSRMPAVHECSCSFCQQMIPEARLHRACPQPKIKNRNLLGKTETPPARSEAPSKHLDYSTRMVPSMDNRFQSPSQDVLVSTGQQGAGVLRLFATHALELKALQPIRFRNSAKTDASSPRFPGIHAFARLYTGRRTADWQPRWNTKSGEYV